MDVPEIHIDVKNTALGYMVVKLYGPTKSDWEVFFDNPRKVSMFLANNSPHVVMSLLSGILTVNTTRERFNIFPDSTLDTDEYSTIMNILPIIKKNAVKLKSLGNS